jgi:segregation and condensation protein B
MEQRIEAILFFKGEPVSLKELSRLLGAPIETVETALGGLRESLSQRGIRLMRVDNSVMLATAPEMTEMIEKVRKEELSRDIGKAGSETLSIILYQGPVSRAQIDYIRGVNSTFILRNLMIRGLVERENNPHDQRSFLYKPTFDLLSYLGVTRKEELPDYDAVQAEIAAYMDEQKREQKVDELETMSEEEE